MIRPTARVGLVLAVSIVLSGACSSGDTDTAGSRTSSSTTAATTTTTGPTTTRPSGAAPDLGTGAVPSEGDCLEPMTQPTADGHQLPAKVPCDAPHGGEIVKVLTLDLGGDAPYPASGADLVGVDPAFGTCQGTDDAPGALPTFLGATTISLTPSQAQDTGVTTAYPVSGIQYAYYVPGTAAWAAGARWFACATVLNNTLELPSSYSGTMRDAMAKRGSLPESMTWCKRESSSAARGDFTAVPCTEAHNFEQLVTFNAGGAETAYPGEDELGRVSSLLCPTLSGLATGGRTDHLPSGIGLGWTYPLEDEWAGGRRVVRCFAVTEDGDSTGAVGTGTSSKGK